MVSNKDKKSNSKKSSTKELEVTKKKATKKIDKLEVKKEESKSKKRNFKTLIVLATIICLMVLGFVINKDDIKYKGFEVHNPDVDLEFDTFLEKVENRDDDQLVFLTLFMDTKTDATLYKAMLLDQIYKEYDFSEHYVYYTNEMTSDENSDLALFLGGEVNAYPMTFLIKNGKVIDYIWGYQVYDSYTQALQEKIEDLDNYKIEIVE